MVTATWNLISKDGNLQRSSHIASVVNGHLLVFGAVQGECVVAQELKCSSNVPSPRVGSAIATIDKALYLFSGRGGVAMKPIDEKGALWTFNFDDRQWSLQTPSHTSGPVPAARSYHCMASDQKANLYVHAGCPETGRLSDMWVFNVPSKSWTQLADAPSPARGGTSIAYVRNKLYRMNGFDGKTEQGGQLDIYDIPTGEWTSKMYQADGIHGPMPRSVSTLLPVQVDGQIRLVTLFGECDPSSLGHAGAGKMLTDVWMYDIEQDQWNEVEIVGQERPAARGWFDGDLIDDTRITIVGGLSDTNERLDDAWMLSF